MLGDTDHGLTGREIGQLLAVVKVPDVEPRIHRTVTDEELLELLTTLSMVHRRLDGTRVTP